MACCIVHANIYDDEEIGKIRIITDENKVRLREAKLLHEKGQTNLRNVYVIYFLM